MEAFFLDVSYGLGPGLPEWIVRSDPVKTFLSGQFEEDISKMTSQILFQLPISRSRWVPFHLEDFGICLRIQSQMCGGQYSLNKFHVPSNLLPEAFGEKWP